MNYQITEWCHRLAENHIEPGDLCIDATMGNGNDTRFLCQRVGPAGRVLAFDIQQAALEQTEKRLREAVDYRNYELHLESHEQMGRYAREGSVSCILFNLGYLPGGDHRLATKADSTIRAMEEGLRLLKQGGAMSVCIYSGGDSGFEERNQVLAWLKELDSRRYLVLVTEYYNRPKNPPIPVLVVKLK
ncbi:MAG: class I SAM-dependent methyltransferase [Lachnospiraceae bacterium]|nr:class I SAM-dependent methyltransferase [Lachnospiraceae bacterium]